MTRKRTPDPESNAPADAEFRAAVRGVTPLAQADVIPRLKTHRPRVRVRKSAPAAAESLEELMPLVAADIGVAGESLLFQRAGLRPQAMRRLRRGLYPCEDELDLHGLQQTAARDQLADFIARSRDAGLRCVRVIHGKGYRSGARGPVLKTAVNLWLRRHMDVMAFVSARAIDGGTGAVYVLLRG